MLRQCVPPARVGVCNDFVAEGALGEISIGPVIADTVFHATGRCVPDVPISPEMLI
jgi:CO/xanthine dehydrogenase Mo-binding subunit